MAVPARISIVTLGVADLPRATAFYRALGWEPTPYSTDEITFIDTAGSMLALFPTDELAADARLGPPAPNGFRGVTLAINVGSDDDVQRVLAEAEAAGATIVKPAEQSPFFAGLDGYFTDPDGHVWEVAHNPDLPLGSGSLSSARDLLPVAAEEFGRRVHAISPDAWANDTADSDWTVRDLVNHLVSEHLWAPPLLAGQSMREVGDRFDGDVLGSDPVAAWDAAIAESLPAWRAVDDEDAVELSAGPTKVGRYAEEMLMDLTVHSWDLSRGTGYDDRIDQACVEHVLAYVEANIDGLRAYEGMFGAEVETTSLDPQDRLLALLGRHP